MDSQNAKQRIRDTDYDPNVSNPTKKSKDNSKTVRLKREKRVAMAKRGIRSLAIAVALPLSLTLSNLYFFGKTRGYGTSTGSTSMPFWFPPPWALHVTSMTSSFLMGLSAWLVWAEGGFHRNPAALYLYLAQLGLSLAWDPIVFRMAAPWVGLLVCLATLGALVGCSRQFKEVNPIAGDLVKPCLAWASFLAIVNLKLLFL
ncbi:translocator protein homolog [Populus alba]|uniref:Benzodiazepine receptor-related family protein n=2 Tax=Populus TaxID=3689 RepID=A0A4U5QSY7_POPAL|nr:translocator protein homolog [Populus alba]KAJ6972973.1 translocator protein [Populus alba x Populus x berolinensis]TKS14153.1 benzodiazepine receptor-related family protein [Populus alba]